MIIKEIDGVLAFQQEHPADLTICGYICENPLYSAYNYTSNLQSNTTFGRRMIFRDSGRGEKIKVKVCPAFSEALQSGNAPSGVTIDLKYSELGNSCAYAFADALGSGYAPSDLSLIISYNKIGVKGIRRLASAIKSGKAPNNLSLELSWYYKNDQCVREIANSLQSGKAPSGLTINLQGNDLGAKNIRVLEAALKSDRCPIGTKIIGISEDFDQRCAAIDKRKIGIATIELMRLTNQLYLPPELINEVLTYLPGAMTCKKSKSVYQDVRESSIKPNKQAVEQAILNNGDFKSFKGETFYHTLTSLLRNYLSINQAGGPSLFSGIADQQQRKAVAEFLALIKPVNHNDWLSPSHMVTDLANSILLNQSNHASLDELICARIDYAAAVHGENVKDMRLKIKRLGGMDEAPESRCVIS